DSTAQFQGLSSALARTLRTLTAALAAEGECWGDDEIGAAFSAAYLPAAQLVGDGMDQVRTRVAEIGDAVGLVADRAVAADRQAQSRWSEGGDR
ncbi:MAG TPA: hypothetical protein VF163_16910, partial [Micromonosporaceae bacterium]